MTEERPAYGTEAYWRRTKWPGDEREKPVLKPIVLSPAPGVVDVVMRTDCAAAAAMERKALAAGWRTMLSVSHFLDVPPYSGKHAGQWVEKRSVALRLARGDVRAYGIWIFADGSWAYDSGEERRPGVARRLSAEDLTGVILDTPAEEIAERKRERARKRARKRAEKKAVTSGA